MNTSSSKKDPAVPPEREISGADWYILLEGIPKVGRVTAAKIARAFHSYSDLKRYPAEQILVRIKRTARAASLVQLLLNPEEIEIRAQEARKQKEIWAKKGISVLARDEDTLPTGLTDLPGKMIANLFFVFGKTDSLQSPVVSFFAAPPLEPDSFEQAQELVASLAEQGIVIATGIHNGFDMVVVKKTTPFGPDSGARNIMVANRGLARIDPSFRPVALSALRNGGVLISPFRPEHGPFDHDDLERKYLQAAVSKTLVFVDPGSAPNNVAVARWALGKKRTVLRIGGSDHEFWKPIPQLTHADFSRVSESLK